MSMFIFPRVSFQDHKLFHVSQKSFQKLNSSVMYSVILQSKENYFRKYQEKSKNKQKIMKVHWKLKSWCSV